MFLTISSRTTIGPKLKPVHKNYQNQTDRLENHTVPFFYFGHSVSFLIRLNLHTRYLKFTSK